MKKCSAAAGMRSPPGVVIWRSALRVRGRPVAVIVSQSLLQLEMVFAVAPNHPLTELRQPLSEADIERYRAVVIADSSRQLLPRTSNVLAAQSRLVVP